WLPARPTLPLISSRPSRFWAQAMPGTVANRRASVPRARSVRRIRCGARVSMTSCWLFSGHDHVDPGNIAAARDDRQLIGVGHLEMAIELPAAVEEAGHIPIVDRLDPDDVRAGVEPADHVVAAAVEGEVPHQLLRPQIEGDDVGAEDAAAVLGDVAADAAEGA